MSALSLLAYFAGVSLPFCMSSEQHPAAHAHPTGRKLLLLALGSLGVVFGDIGTSPLYALNEMFFGHEHIALTQANEIGAVSLIIWALTLVVTVKYICFVLRADNDGQGGVFALYALLSTHRRKLLGILSLALILGAGLLYGDGLITPAISVLSAVEGLGVAAPALSAFVIPITILILTGLFAIQRRGTGSVGKIFGPIVLCWFGVIALLGLTHLVHTPAILQALNPLAGLTFLRHTPLHISLVILGAVMLSITGGEALYADMGHFGKRPIRIGWFAIVYPALMLNYLGQGAYLLSGQSITGDNLFYSTVPAALRLPMVLLATMATVIASQALISGVFSLMKQAVALDIFPRMRIVNTHHEHEGQVYIPLVNWSLYAGCVLLVLAFRTSTNLASAYGLAVSVDMFVTSLAMIAVARLVWKWKLPSAIALFGVFALIDATFLGANMLKLFEGGYVPLSIGLVLFAIMTTWAWGRRRMRDVLAARPTMTMRELVALRRDPNTPIIPRSFLVLNRRALTNVDDTIPYVMQMVWDRFGALPKHFILLNVVTLTHPYAQGERHHVTKFFDENGNGSIASVRMNFGFMQDRNVQDMLGEMANHHEVQIDADPKTWLIHMLKERPIPRPDSSPLSHLRVHLYNLLDHNAESSDRSFGLGYELALSKEVTPVPI